MKLNAIQLSGSVALFAQWKGSQVLRRRMRLEWNLWLIIGCLAANKSEFSTIELD